MEKLKELGSLFYVVNPYETMFEKVSDIPTPDWTAKVPICWRSITLFMFYKYWSSTYNIKLKILCTDQQNDL